MLIGKPTEKVIRHAHMFCGIGVCAHGFNLAQPRVGDITGRFECVGGIDVDAGAIRNFQRMTGVPGRVLDLFTLDQYLAFHGKAPPPGWQEATSADIYETFGQLIDVMFLSAPCKGFSGLLSATQSKTDKYQALNGLTLHGIWLALEAYKDDPIPIILFENVPRIATRGRHLLEQIKALLRSYGYNVNEDTHDCGVIGGLAQSRKRYLLIARHPAKIPPFIYQPKQHRLRGVGEVIGKLPLPGDPIAGPMHRVPALQWKTWVRLAFVPAGKDWRALNDLVVENGVLRDYGILPEQALRDNSLGVCAWDETAPVITAQRAPGQGRFSVADPRVDGMHRDGLGVRGWDQEARVVAAGSRPANGAHSVADPRPAIIDRASSYGVKDWEAPAGTVAGESFPTNGAFSVADPRPPAEANQTYYQYGVNRWDENAGTVSGQSLPGGGAHSVADPRLPGKPRFNNVFRIVPFDSPAPAVAGPGGPAGGLAVADPRPEGHDNYTTTKYKVCRMEQPTRAVIGASSTGDGAFAVADPRPAWGLNRHRNILRVTAEDEPAGTIAGTRSVTGGQPCVADSRAIDYNTQGHFGVSEWDAPSGAVPGYAKYDRGRWSVADPREVEFDGETIALPAPDERLVCRIISPDNTWHRPFTTLDLAALQSLFDPEEAFGFADGAWFARAGFDLDAQSDVSKREWIGNAVPGAAARGMAETVGEAIILASIGETFVLSSREIWVKPGALALAVDSDQLAYRMERGE